MSSNEIMFMNWQQMIMPDKVAVEGDRNYGKFVCEPLERGFGITIGNALRRVILSSLYGAAIVSVKFDDVMHEFSTIEGVMEDVSEIILNLKEVRLKADDAQPRELRLSRSGEGEANAGDLVSPDGRITVLNPEQHIATLTGGQINATLQVRVGKGYSLAEHNKEEDDTIGLIPIDAVFSPIQRVVYVVGNARVGQRTDYDKLTLEVWTDGSIGPEDAVAFAAKIMKEQMNIFINFDESAAPELDTQAQEEDTPQFNENLFRSVEELELSVRSANCLKNAEIHKIWQLVTKTEAEMLRTKNFGRKSLNEIKEVLSEMGLSLGMKLEGFDVPEEEIEQEE